MNSIQGRIPDSLKTKQKKDAFLKTTGIDLELMEPIDGGAQAIVYGVIGSHTVVKATYDRNEAQFCAYLKKKNSKRPYLPKIYGVYRYGKTYFIHMEALTPRSQREKDEVQAVLSEGWGTPLSHRYQKYLTQTIKIRVDLKEYCLRTRRYSKYMQSLGITRIDYHGGNIMKRNKSQEIVFIDFGFMQSNLTAEYRKMRITNIK